MRKLNAQKRSSIRRHRTSERRSKAREESLVAALAVQLADDASDGDVALGSLQTRLDGIDGEDGNPHGHAGTGSGAGNGRQAQLAGGLAGLGIGRAQLLLDDLVGGEVGGAAGPVAGEGGGAATEDGAQAALAVELAHDVEAAAVFGLLAGRELLLALDLEDDLDALKGRGDGRHGDGREEAGGGELAGREAVRADGRGGADDLLAEIVAPEGDGDCECQQRCPDCAEARQKDHHQKLHIHMGVTPTSGALTPAYRPLLSPSRAIDLRTTSMALE